MSERAVREMTFEEEYEILKEESEKLFENETGYGEPPLANCLVRNALRCITKLQEEMAEDGKDTNVPSKWIPCSERLPELGKYVLCMCRGNIQEVMRLTPDGWFHDHNHCYMGGFVIAWMPLPEPYKEE